MALENSIREHAASLTSLRATDRKRNAETLKSFLTGNAVPALLTENTLKKCGYTWNNLFDDINDYILKETEKFETSKTFDSITAPLCTSLLHLCVTGCNKDKAYVKCEKVTEACLFILRDNRLSKAIGDAYLNLLYKYILPNEHYSEHITPATWEELLDVCISVYLSHNSKLDDFTKLKLIYLIIKNAIGFCQFAIPLRNAITRLKACFHKIINDKKATDTATDIMILLLETLSFEYRLTMCEFTESILTSILNFYDQNNDQRKKTSLFKLLNLTMIIHHPQGRLRTEEGSLANDWVIWDKHLYGILEIVTLEITYLQRYRKQSDVSLKQCSNDFFCLAASLYYQVFRTFVKEDVAQTSSKKQKVTLNKYTTVKDIITELQQNHVPWLGVMNMFVKKYGVSISVVEYLSLINVIESLITKNNSNIEWIAFEELACTVIKHLISHLDYKRFDGDVLLSLWNSCVRNCSLANGPHKALHTIMQLLLKLNIVTQFHNVQPLMRLYFDKGMPLTDNSLITLNHVFYKFYNKYSYTDERLKCFEWFSQGDIISLRKEHVREFFIKLVAYENVTFVEENSEESECDKLYDTVFGSVEKCILFSKFELSVDIPNSSRETNCEQFEINKKLHLSIHNYLKEKLSEEMCKIKKKEIKALQFIKSISIALTYYDIITKNDIRDDSLPSKSSIYRLLESALQIMYAIVTNLLKEDAQNVENKMLLESITDILVTNYHPLLKSKLRQSIDQDFFHVLNDIITTDYSSRDEETLYEDDIESDPNALKHLSLHVLTAYVLKIENYWNEVVELIFDPKLCNFNITWDTKCIFQCIEMLNNFEIEKFPLESVFNLMQTMCKYLFRCPKITFSILRILSKILNNIWAHDENMKTNCYIMVKSYLQRCEKMYYPPYVAAKIYECAAKVASLNCNEENHIRKAFVTILIERAKGNIHSIRLYCCYLLKLIDISDSELELCMAGLLEMFTVNVTDEKQQILEDELANRSSSLLHIVYSLTQAKSIFINRIILEMLHIQAKKSLKSQMVKKVLNKITKTVTEKSIEEYLNNNILSILYSWFSKNNKLEELPLYLFGFDNMNSFLEMHIKYLMSADVLWRKQGNVENSDILKLVTDSTGKSAESIIEICFCNIIILCIPYTVIEKYNLSYKIVENRSEFIKSTRYASEMFQLTRQILDNEKWSNLFVENMGELILLAATHMRDHDGARERFKVAVPNHSEIFYYTKDVFSAILKYFGELIDDNIMQYLCENQPTAMFKILFELWGNVQNEKVFQFKVISLYTFISFIENIPLGFTSDAVVCNFTCNNFTHAIKESRNKEELRVFVEGLKTVLHIFLPETANILSKTLSRTLSVMTVKKDEGYRDECLVLLNYLTNDVKKYLNDSRDVLDFAESMVHSFPNAVLCYTKDEFEEKLNTYLMNLCCPSYESVVNLRRLIESNKNNLDFLNDNLNHKGFSDECGKSPIYQIINTLTKIISSTSDEKTVIEACNCLADVGTYDLKTLVTVQSADVNKLVDLDPKKYFAIAVLSSLSAVLFDDDATVTNKVGKALYRMFKFGEGRDALDLGDFDIQILKPFISSGDSIIAEFKINSSKFNTFSVQDYWIPNEGETHLQWLARITIAVLDMLSASTNYISALQTVCQAKPNLCTNILPPLIGLLLQCSSENNTAIISQQMNRFFKYVWDESFSFVSHNNKGDGKKFTHSPNQNQKLIIKYILDVVNFVRLQKRHYRVRPNHSVETFNYLKLDYDKVAWAATLADQNLAAIYYGELWLCKESGVPPSSPEVTTQIPGGENVQRIFRKCYVSIGEMDAIEGCGTAHLTSETEKRKHLINTGQFTDALLLYDIALSRGGQLDSELHYGVVTSLHNSGMHHLALQYIKSLPETDELNDVKYECMSFLGDWTAIVDKKSLEGNFKNHYVKPESLIKAYRYACLKDCINMQKSPNFSYKLEPSLNKAKLAVSRLCNSLNMENCQSVYKIIEKLQLFRDTEDYFRVRSGITDINRLLDKWQVDKLPPFRNFQHIEALVSQRSLLLGHAAEIFESSLKEIVSLQLQCAELALSNQRVQMAERIVASVKKLQSLEDVALLKGRISWAKGHKDIALSLLRNILSNQSLDVKLTAISLRQYGLWVAETKYDNARDIINKYLKKSIDVLTKSDHEETRLKIYHDIAKFADAEYKQVVSYMNSTIFENKLKCLENLKGTVTAVSLLSTQQTLTKDERKAWATNDRFRVLDEAEIASTKAEKQRFLHLAMRYYLLSLKHCERNNLTIFRVISLWLDNQTIDNDLDGDSFEDLLHSIPSRKFITVLPQLAPRLTLQKCAFAENLKVILKRCAVEHPHHTLPILFSMKNSDKDRRAASSASAVDVASEPRTLAAAALVLQLAAECTTLAAVIQQMDRICDAIISFANYVPKTKDLKQKVPSTEPINNLRNLEAVPIPTDSIAIRNNCDYSFISSFVSFENYFELVGGINCPKKISCVSSNGKRRFVLIKGEDDMRQDAVMQQVFNIVNTLLEKNPVTSRNNLLIRTYKVVPMSRRSGVLEWCEGTMPLGSYLLGPTGAHARYRPMDISNQTARKNFMKGHEKRLPDSEKLLIFKKILEEFRPVFHYFFTENYLEPVTWYERRLAYTKSVATSSMVGYIMGLGDRHVQNILIDKKTAEVIHIDFGIAFDQGKALPTPETIPFRLTQDIVAGFGSSGVEGIFRRCSEKTMQLLRDNQEILLTILEVLLCDPLYSWTINSTQQRIASTPLKETDVQGSGEGRGGLAERALMAVRGKLAGGAAAAGADLALPAAVGVQGQVARLICLATDPANLCRLFPGWQPYL